MKATPLMAGQASQSLSDLGRARLLSCRGEPLFLAGWERALFIHFEVDAERLQRDVPFRLDLHESRAYVSLVAFAMRRMRFRRGGPVLEWLLKPIGNHDFLNVRTYVTHNGECGIYFMTEWLSNWLSVQLGPWLYGLPYHYAKIHYQHRHEKRHLEGTVEGTGTRRQFAYQAECETDMYVPVENGSLDEFLVERYTAYTACGLAKRFFRIWHPPWPQQRVKVQLRETSLLRATWPWFADARLAGANYSPGFSEVWMGRPSHLMNDFSD